MNPLPSVHLARQRLPGTAGWLLLRGAHTLWMSGDLRSSREHFDAAYRAAADEDDHEAMGLAAVGFAGLWVHEQRDVAGAALVESRLRQALLLADPGSALAVRLRTRLAAEADYRAGTAARTLALLEQARQVADPVTMAEAASLAHHCLLGPDHVAEREALNRELIEAALRTGNRGYLLLGLLWRTVDLFLAGDPHAERRLAELREQLGVQDHGAVRYVVLAIETMLDLRAGRFSAAELHAAECRRLGEAAGDLDAVGWFGAHVVAIRWFQGRLTELLPMLEELVHSPTLSAVDNAHLAALAVATAQAGDHARAAAALARLRGTDLARLPRSSSWLVAMYGIVEAAHLLGDAETAADAYRLLLPFGHLPMTASLGVACFGSVEHALGVAALTMGEPGRAAGHLHAAVQANLALGHLPAAELARTRLAALTAKPSAERAGRRVQCRRQGRCWELSLDADTILVPDSVGMGYLAELLANPGREIPAVDLAAGPGGPPLAGQVAQPVLDDAAKRAYRRQLDELQAEIDEHEAANDLLRAERARAERTWLVDELAAASGLAGRTRQFSGNPERARISVGKALRRALDRVALAHPAIGAELRLTVRTGVRCGYRPVSS